MNYSGLNGNQSPRNRGGLSRDQYQQMISSVTGPGVNAAAAARDIRQAGLFNGNGGYSNGGYRSDWQQAISQATQQYGVNAAQAAQMLDPYWQGRGEAQANTPGTQSGRGRSRSRSNSRNGYSNGYDGMDYESTSNVYGQGVSTLQNLPTGYADINQSELRQYTPRELGATVQNGKIRGLDREGYQVLISQLTGPGVNAAQAAKFLDHLILSQQENPGMTAQQWQQLISRTTQQYGVNAAQAAQLLDPYYRGVREAGTKYDMPAVGFSNGYNGRSRSRSRSPSRSNGLAFPDYLKASEVSTGLEGGYLEGLRGAQSFRAGTPAESTDRVLNIGEATALAAAQASQAPPRITNRPTYTFNTEQLRTIAQALGLPTGGDGLTLVGQIRSAVGQMSPRSQRAFAGQLSPRSLQALNNF